MSVTDLLRHLYARLDRDGDHAPVPGSEAERKVKRLLDKLEERNVGLLHKKRRLLDKKAEYTQAAVRQVTAIADLISRAHVVWERYQSSTSLLADEEASRWSVVS